MITIKSTTKRGAGFLAAYNRSSNRRLSDCYGKYSTEKARAEKYCLSCMSNEDGAGFKIISYNCNFFSAAWQTAAGLRVETPTTSILVI